MSNHQRLLDRLSKRAKEDREMAENSAVVRDLLQPELDKCLGGDGKEPWNAYAVRLATDHRNDATRGFGFADDLDAVIALIAKLTIVLETLVEHCANVEQEVTEKLHGVEYTGESLPLCNARSLLKDVTTKKAEPAAPTSGEIAALRDIARWAETLVSKPSGDYPLVELERLFDLGSTKIASLREVRERAHGNM